MIDGLKPILCMVTGIAYISVQDSDACREKSHLVGAKWTGAKWNIVQRGWGKVEHRKQTPLRTMQ